MKSILLCIVLLFCVTIYAQTEISGNVKDNNGLPLLGTNVIITGTTKGTVTDFDRNFKLSVSKEPPFTIEISSVGFKNGIIQITKNNQTINAKLEEGTSLDEI